MTDPVTVRHATREEWLGAAIDAVRPIFTDAKASLPDAVRVSVGFGYNGAAENKNILAQAWDGTRCADGVPAVFISPVIADAVDALSALMHELVHLACDAGGHGKAFRLLGEAVGLEGKPTQMLPGVGLSAVLITVMDVLGAYPHAALDPAGLRERSAADGDGGQASATGWHTGPAAQTNRHLAVVCMNVACLALGYQLRTTRKWLAVAAPICPVCLTVMSAGQ